MVAFLVVVVVVAAVAVAVVDANVVVAAAAAAAAAAAVYVVVIVAESQRIGRIKDATQSFPLAGTVFADCVACGHTQVICSHAYGHFA